MTAETNGRRRAMPGATRRTLDGAQLEQLALAYVARFATSAGRLSSYLRRKVGERDWRDDSEPETAIAGLVARFVAAGYVDDAAFARARSAGLTSRGYGSRRIEQVLRGAGIDEDVRTAAMANEGDARRAALRLASKRGFGPFGTDARPHPALRQKQIAAMLRAGHPLDSARELMDAASVAEALRWAGEDET